MIPVATKLQIDRISVDRGKPLLICDVDEVIVHFISDFEEFLALHGCRLVIGKAHLSGRTIEREADGELLSHEDAFAHMSTFFAQRTRTMQPIRDAVSSINMLADEAEIVFLTNLPAEAHEDRRANLDSLGLGHPVVVNSGPKGPAIRALAAKTERSVAFVDDSHHFIQSSFEYAPHVRTVHFLQDERFHPHVPELDFVGLRSNNWIDTLAFLRSTLAD